MKSFLPSLVILCLLIHWSIQFDCNDKKSSISTSSPFYSSFNIQNCYNCIAKNGEKKVNIPILNGRHCYIPSSSSSSVQDCNWYDEPVEEGINQYEDAYCGTEIEACNAKIPSTKDYNTCIYTQVEAPYKCCYIGNGKTNRCMALDVHDKKIFKETLYHIRVFDGDYQGDYEIECSSSYLKLTSLFLLAFFFFF